MNVSILLGETLTKIDRINNEELIFHTVTDRHYKMYHQQDCCESVSIDDIVGDLDDLIGSTLTLAEESSNQESGEYGESETWTFYKFATVKGYVTIKWYGSSNGYYSEYVDFEQI